MIRDFDVKRVDDNWVVVDSRNLNEVTEPANETITREICRALNRPQLKRKLIAEAFVGSLYTETVIERVKRTRKGK